MPPFDQHLQPADFDLVIDERAGDNAGLHSHLEVCEECAAALGYYRQAEKELSGMRQVAEQMNLEEINQSERVFIASLQSASPKWQRDLAGRLCAQKPSKFRRPAVWNWFWAPIAAAAIVIGVGWWITHRPNPVDTLLAKAYTKLRPTEFRLPDAGYREVTLEKGGLNKVLSNPEIVEALHRLNGSAGTPENKRRRARVLLLQGFPGAALEELALLPDNSENRLLLACAYFLRAEPRPDTGMRDYARSLEYLDRILRAEPDNRVALFNIALVHERMLNNAAAISAWESYKKRETDAGYLREADRHLETLRREKARRDQVLDLVGGSPTRFLRYRFSERQQNAELFLDAALTDWAPRQGEASSAESAARRAADLLKKQSGDPFLSDILRGPLPLNAVDELRQAIVLNRSARPAEGERHAAHAARLFSSAGNPTAAMRAALERVYGLHRSAQPGLCLDDALRLEQRLSTTPYIWMAVQNRIEKAVCLAYQGEIAEAIENAELAARTAHRATLPSLELRANGMLSGFLVQVGDTFATWRLARDHLSTYWSGAYPVNYAHQLYGDLSDAAGKAGLPYASYRLRRVSVDAIAQTDELLLHASGRNLLSLAARQGDDPQAADEEDASARALFERIPPSTLRNQYLVDADIRRAAWEVKQDRPASALPLLNGLLIRPAVTEAARMRVLENLGAALWQTGRVDEAREAALRCIERNREITSSLPSGERRQTSARRQVEAYRLLAEIDLSSGQSPAAAFVRWQTLRALENPQIAASPIDGSSASPEHQVRNWSQQLLESAVVTLVDLPAGPVVWYLDRAGLQSRRITASPGELAKRANSLIRQCAQPNSNQGAIERAAEELTSLVFGELAARLRPGQALVVDGENYLARVALALSLGKDQPVLVRSAGVSEYLRHRDNAAHDFSRDRLLLVYGATPPPDQRLAMLYPSFPEAEREADEVAAHFATIARLHGAPATPAAFARAVANSNVVHFSGHGTGDDEKGALLLSASDQLRPYSGFVTAQQIRREDWGRCRLAVLSGCETAAGEAEGSSNPESLVRAILSGGARNVIASQWSVEAKSTRRFFHVFYGKLKGGMLPAHALREAAKEIRSHPETSHPYYWASFQIFGQG